MRVTEQRQPVIDERCRGRADTLHPVGFYEIPERFAVPDSYGLLTSELMDPLLNFIGDPVGLLATAADLHDRGEIERAFALAETVASGRSGYTALQAGTVTFDAVLEQARRPDSSHIEGSVGDVLDRVYRVAWALEGLSPREDFGWLGVCALTDPPRRPVNVPSAPYPQFDIRVNVQASGAATAQTVDTRFLFYRRGLHPESTTAIEDALERRELPTLVLPEISAQERVVLFVHGHTSRGEECEPLAEALLPMGYTVVSVDLPGSGYATQFDPTTVGPAPAANIAAATTGPYSALDFLEQFLSDFVDALDERFGTAVSQQIVGVVGGSLGGNMGLRLAERLPYAAWRQTVAAWSPASVWGLSWARARHAVSEDDEYYDFAKFESVRVTRDRMNQVEDTGMANRQAYFAQVFYGWETIDPQADRWYRDGWDPCKAKYKLGAEADRQELYTALFRRWHWRVAHEQLCFMHLEPPTPGGLARFETIHSRVFLGAGGEDGEYPENLWDNTIDLAEQALHIQGHSMFLRDTGHSIIAERPRELAAELGRFFPTHSPEVTGADPFGGWTSLGGDALRPQSLAVAPNEDGRLELFGIRISDRRLVSQRQERVNGDYPGFFADIGVSRGVPTGVTFDSRLAAVPLHGGQLRLYARRSDENGWIVHFTQDRPNGVMQATDLGNHARQLLGAITEGPAVCERLGWNDPAHNPQRLHLVAGLYQEQHIKIRGQTIFEFPNNYWVDQPDLSTQTFTGSPALGRLQDGRLLIAARRPDGEVFYRAEDSTDNWSTDWQRAAPGNAASDPTLVRDWQGRLNLFVTGSDGHLWHSIHDPSSENWGPWIDLGGQPAEGARPAAALDAWGGLEVFVRTINSQLAYLREIPYRGFEWSAWTELMGTLTSDPVISSTVNGALAVFGLDDDGRAQVISHSHPWSFGAERGVTGSHKNSEGDIDALCNPAEPWSPREVANVIEDIESGAYTYVTVANGIASEIQVVDGAHGKYLRTRPDSTPDNNLDNLPDC